MKEIEKLFSAEDLFQSAEAENPEIKKLYRNMERLETEMKAVCGDKAGEYADLHTKLVYEMSKYSFLEGVKTGINLNKL